ncbi:hypothetical protein [Mitsuaria sp. PDC51]|uniref:hypothetical protein n=1 Tax=Mitsuaria sp. PDC51 TaxID=1881035 RepID=UPI0011401AAB|nr:hypothetical protein [Mitsuaria sp. PDC51]
MRLDADAALFLSSHGAAMLGLLNLDKVKRLGAKRFLVLFALAVSAMFFGLFVAIGVLIEGEYVARRGFLVVSLAYGFLMTAIFGWDLWRSPPPDHGDAGEQRDGQT